MQNIFLFSNFHRETVTKVLKCSLEKHSIFNIKALKTTVELSNNKICFNQIVTEKGNQLYTQKHNCNCWYNHCFIDKHFLTLHPSVNCWYGKLGGTYISVDSLITHMDNDITNILWICLSGNNFNNCPQWLGHCIQCSQGILKRCLFMIAVTFVNKQIHLLLLIPGKINDPN